MCDVKEIKSAGQALAALRAGLAYLNEADAAALPTVTQAELLKGLERAESALVAARSQVLAAFTSQRGFEGDAAVGARAWLGWHTRVTRSAAAASVAWAKRLSAHPVLAGALADGELTTSWTRHLCAWTDQLPADKRDDADTILAAAAAQGADLRDLAGLAEQMRDRAAGPDTDHGTTSGDGFADRWFRLDVTYQGAGRAEGDLSPGCAAALQALLDALGKKHGPEDTRTAAQRHHDALEDACRRLIASGQLPGRAGQPTQIQVHMSLRDLLRQTGNTQRGSGQPEETQPEETQAEDHDDAWRRAVIPGWLTGAEAAAAACDATVVPTVTGYLDHAALARLTDAFTAARLRQASQPLAPWTRTRLAQALLRLTVQTLSGPSGIASQLRQGLGGPLASVSLPLDTGAPTAMIPPHLRRAATLRHRWCAFAGCRTPASACDLHHLIPRSQGGATALHNLLPLCRFHHLVVIHQWGWTLKLNPDGTTIATSPAGRDLHSHSPPDSTAA